MGDLHQARAAQGSAQAALEASDARLKELEASLAGRGEQLTALQRTEAALMLEVQAMAGAAGAAGAADLFGSPMPTLGGGYSPLPSSASSALALVGDPSAAAGGAGDHGMIAAVRRAMATLRSQAEEHHRQGLVWQEALGATKKEMEDAKVRGRRAWKHQRPPPTRPGTPTLPSPILRPFSQVCLGPVWNWHAEPHAALTSIADRPHAPHVPPPCPSPMSLPMSLRCGCCRRSTSWRARRTTPARRRAASSRRTPTLSPPSRCPRCPPMPRYPDALTLSGQLPL